MPPRPPLARTSHNQVTGFRFQVSGKTIARPIHRPCAGVLKAALRTSAPTPPHRPCLAPLPPLWCLTLAPATPSRLQQGPNIELCVVPAVRRTWSRGFLLPLGRGFHAKIRRLFFEDGASLPTLAGLMSASGRLRRARTKKRPLVFAPPQCKRNPLLL